MHEEKEINILNDHLYISYVIYVILVRPFSINKMLKNEQRPLFHRESNLRESQVGFEVARAKTSTDGS